MVRKIFFFSLVFPASQGESLVVAISTQTWTCIPWLVAPVALATVSIRPYTSLGCCRPLHLLLHQVTRHPFSFISDYEGAALDLLHLKKEGTWYERLLDYTHGDKALREQAMAGRYAT